MSLFRNLKEYSYSYLYIFKNNMKITENDIETIEQMHDILLENNKIKLDSILSENSRDLASRMYAHIQAQQKESDINNLVEKSKYLEKKHNLKITLTFE